MRERERESKVDKLIVHVNFGITKDINYRKLSNCDWDHARHFHIVSDTKFSLVVVYKTDTKKHLKRYSKRVIGPKDFHFSELLAIRWKGIDPFEVDFPLFARQRFTVRLFRRNLSNNFSINSFPTVCCWSLSFSPSSLPLSFSLSLSLPLLLSSISNNLLRVLISVF